jgi:hypothetical protein
MTLLIRHPPGCLPERDFVWQVVFGEFLGLEWQAQVHESAETTIELRGSADGRRLSVADRLFSYAPTDWLSTATLPELPLPVLSVGAVPALSLPPAISTIPVIYGDGRVRISPTHCFIGADLFGSIFFLLSRYEEYVSPVRDAHGRFPATASLAQRAGFLWRPIVNEYLEVLWTCLMTLWPGLSRKARQSRIRPTCDVDSPFTCWARSTRRTFRKAALDVVRSGDLKSAAAALRLHHSHRRGRYEHDPLFNFEWIRAACESANRRATFYFIAGQSNLPIDGCYDLGEPVIRRLLRTLHESGHEIGLHGSYGTAENGKLLGQELQRLQRILHEEGIEQQNIGGRQHYLRWSPRMAAAQIDSVGLTHDSSLGFADSPGFRCGTCYEFPLFDLAGRRVLLARERPLIMMEQSIISPLYLGMGETPAALAMMLNLRQSAEFYRGDFTFLWHNSSLLTPYSREMYRSLLAD